MISLLSGQAFACTTAVWQHKLTDSSTLDTIRGTKLRGTFNHPHEGKCQAASLLQICQEARYMADYVIDIWTCAALSCWNTPSLQVACVQG